MAKKNVPNLPKVNIEINLPKKADNNYSTLKHMANLGDIVATLASIWEYYRVTKRKVMYCQVVNAPGGYYQGATHPTVDESGNMVTLNQPMFEMIKPLIESQECIHSFVRYEGQAIKLNFDSLRTRNNIGMPNGMLAAWPILIFPDLACDLSKPYLFLPEKSHPVQKQTKRKVIINFTDRYRNPMVDYFFLKNYAPDLIFAGTEREHWNFCNKWALTIPRLEIKDFLEFAYAIKGARFILGNQSFCWNIAEAMKTPRVLEMCSWAANCQPFIGEKSYGFYDQVSLEYYFRRMYNETN